MIISSEQSGTPKKVLMIDHFWRRAGIPQSARQCYRPAHFQWAKPGGYVTQVTAIGPLALERLDRTDEPRQHQ
jgi:hypothetical protein